MVAFLVTAVIMIFVIPAFKNVFTSFGADLPAPTLVVIAMSDFFVKYWYLDLRHCSAAASISWCRRGGARRRCRRTSTGLLLKLPVFGDMLQKSSIARWSGRWRRCSPPAFRWSRRSTRSAARGRQRRLQRSDEKIQTEVNVGTSLAQVDAEHRRVSEHGAADDADRRGVRLARLDAVARPPTIYEREVDETVDALSSLMEPMIMVILGVIIGGIVIAMYLPIFKLGQVV